MRIKLAKVAVVGEDLETTTRICSHFRSFGVYLPLFETPAIRMEGFGVYEADCIRLTNALIACKPHTVIFAGCQEKTLIKLKSLLPTLHILVIDKWDENKLCQLPGFRSKISKANTLDTLRNYTGQVIAVERGLSLANLIAENLAIAEGASLYIMPSVDLSQLKYTEECLRRWNNSAGEIKDDAREEFLDLVRLRLNEIADAKLSSVSFFTLGIPYGVYPLHFPATHFFTFPNAGVSVVSGILKSVSDALRCSLTVLIDPGKTGDSEIESVRKAFRKAHFTVRIAKGSTATANNARYLSEYMPSDYLFYTTHCGEVRGTRVVEAFNFEGITHEITYDLVRSYAPREGTDIVEVQDLYKWVAVDDVLWSNEKEKERINAGNLLEAFMHRDTSVKTILSTAASDLVRHSDSLQMYDFAYSPLPQVIGGYQYPIVFNNACASWLELAGRYAPAGTSVYIGTSQDALNSVATFVAEKFAYDAARGRAIGPAIYRAQADFIKSLGYCLYLMHGYLFTATSPLAADAPSPRNLVLMRLREALKRNERMICADEFATNRRKAVTVFLKNEIDSLASDM